MVGGVYKGGGDDGLTVWVISDGVQWLQWLQCLGPFSQTFWPFLWFQIALGVMMDAVPDA